MKVGDTHYEAKIIDEHIIVYAYDIVHLLPHYDNMYLERDGAQYDRRKGEFCATPKDAVLKLQRCNERNINETKQIISTWEDTLNLYTTEENIIEEWLSK